MLKYNAIKKIGSIIKEVSESVAKKLTEMQDDITGRETEITSQLKSEVNLHLMDKIVEHLDNKVINGVNFKVYTYRSKEEKHLGADFAGFIEFHNNSTGETVSKAFLAQAKVAKKRKKGNIYCSNKDIIRQANDMLNISSDSFFFLYTNNGIYVVPAFGVKLGNKNVINTKEVYYHRFGHFYEEFFKCFIGDHKISNIYDKPKDLKRYAEQFRVKNIIHISASLKGEEQLEFDI